jgi:hypothetical protein
MTLIKRTYFVIVMLRCAQHLVTQHDKTSYEPQQHESNHEQTRYKERSGLKQDAALSSLDIS